MPFRHVPFYSAVVLKCGVLDAIEARIANFEKSLTDFLERLDALSDNRLQLDEARRFFDGDNFGHKLVSESRKTDPTTLERGLQAQAIRETVSVHFGVISLPHVPSDAFAEQGDLARDVEEISEG